MTSRSHRRLGVALAVALAVAPLLAAGPPPRTEHFTGKVVPLAAALEKQGAKLDADAGPYWLALVGDGDKVYPLVKDDGARMFFKDERLLNRPMRLTGRLLPGNLLQVVAVHSIIKGELHEVYYWCDVCSIRRYEKKPCDCCGGPMQLREEPLRK